MVYFYHPLLQNYEYSNNKRKPISYATTPKNYIFNSGAVQSTIKKYSKKRIEQDQITVCLYKRIRPKFLATGQSQANGLKKLLGIIGFIFKNSPKKFGDILRLEWYKAQEFLGFYSQFLKMPMKQKLKVSSDQRHQSLKICSTECYQCPWLGFLRSIINNIYGQSLLTQV